jgi:hypothetical protein
MASCPGLFRLHEGAVKSEQSKAWTECRKNWPHSHPPLKLQGNAGYQSLNGV